MQLAMPLHLAVMLVTKHNLPESERDCSFVVTNLVGKKRGFDKLLDTAQWAAANALGKPESEWFMKRVHRHQRSTGHFAYPSCNEQGHWSLL